MRLEGETPLKIRANVIVKGIVQEVCFRHYTQQTAILHNVAGWVRNLPNGNVEGCFEGEEDNVRALIELCRRGPDHAHVEEVTVETSSFQGEFKGFNVRF
jgi:acylphosphatase